MKDFQSSKSSHSFFQCQPVGKIFWGLRKLLLPSLFFLLTTGGVGAMGELRAAENLPPQGQQQKAASMAQAAPPASASAKASLYAAPLELRGLHGEAVPFGVYQGAPVLVSMFYGTCTYTCPLLIKSLQNILAGLTAAEREHVRVLLISLDASDTEKSLQKLVSGFGIDTQKWQLLVGQSEDQVQEAAALLGVKYRRLPSGEINHNTVVSVLDAHGVLQGRFERSAAADEKSAIQEKLKELVRAQAGVQLPQQGTKAK